MCPLPSVNDPEEKRTFPLSSSVIISILTETSCANSYAKCPLNVFAKRWLNDSSSFEEKGFDNPATKIYPDRTITAENVKLGDFNVSSSLLNKLTTETVITDLPIDSIEARGLKVSPDGSGYTNVIDEANPQIGDVRIKFYKNSATDISILAVQSGDTFKSYTNKLYN